MAPKGAPDTALAIAWRMAHVVKTLVDRPMHVATVKGLKRKLGSQYHGEGEECRGSHTKQRAHTRPIASLDEEM